MKLRITVICSALLLLSLSACGSQAPAPADSIASHAPSPSESASLAPPSASSTDPEPEVEPSPMPEPTPVEKTYRMNNNYFIVPIDKENTDSKVVLLTFDDGPKDPETLNPLLDTLDKYNAKAIFFVNGYRVKANPELLTAIAERNQIIGNHSWDHINLKKESAEVVKEQIEKVQQIVQEITGNPPVFFRPPHGASNDDVRAVAKENKLLFMNWSNGSLDWDMGKIPEENRPQAVIDNVLEQLHSGSNILMHELPWTAKALDDLLSQLEQKGYSFVDPNAIDTEL